MNSAEYVIRLRLFENGNQRVNHIGTMVKKLDQLLLRQVGKNTWEPGTSDGYYKPHRWNEY